MKKNKHKDNKKTMITVVSLILAALLLITLLAGIIPAASHNHSHTAMPITASREVDAV